MAKKKAVRKKKSVAKTSVRASAGPTSFSALTKRRSQPVQKLALALRALVYEEFPNAKEHFFGNKHAMAMYRDSGDICFIQPLTDRCNFYLARSNELTDDDGLLEGTAKNIRHVKVKSIDAMADLPLRSWLQQTRTLEQADAKLGVSAEQVLENLRKICLPLPDTTETITWGKPHFRVADKIFCGCGGEGGRTSLGFKMEMADAAVMVNIPGITKAPYVGNKGWVSLDPSVFDDWDEIEQMVIGSYRMIAPKRTLKKLDT